MGQKICEIINQYIPKCHTLAFTDGQTMLIAMEDNCPDAVFLDIDMPTISGLEVAEKMTSNKKRPILIFVTAHDELVYESLKFHPFSFVRKKYLETEMRAVLEDCIKALSERDKRFHFRMEGKDFNILISEITYFESDANYIDLHMATEIYHIRSTITMLENALKEDGFVRIHKGFLVNQMHVRCFSKEEVRLMDGTILPIGKSFEKGAATLLLRYIRE